MQAIENLIEANNEVMRLTQELCRIRDVAVIWEHIKKYPNATTQLRHNCVALRNRKQGRDSVKWFSRSVDGDGFLSKAAAFARKDLQQAAAAPDAAQEGAG